MPPATSTLPPPGRHQVPASGPRPLPPEPATETSPEPEQAAKPTQCVYAVDDDPNVLAVLRTMLSQSGFAVACFASATEFLDELPVLPPGMVVTDQVMADLTGIDLLRRLVAQRPSDFRLILISAYPRTSLTVAAMKLGAITVLDKPFDRRELMLALADGFQKLNAAEDTELTIPPVLPSGESYLNRLSAREREVILMVYQGKTNKSISITLRLSIKTVEKHRARAMRKMEVNSLAGLIRLIDREMELGTTSTNSQTPHHNA